MSRTVKKAVDRTRITFVLGALMASMTIGAIILWVLEPSKTHRTDKLSYMAATWYSEPSQRISQTAIPIERERWQSVVIHGYRPSTAKDVSLRCLSGQGGSVVAHFAVEPDGHVLMCRPWVKQESADRLPGKILIGVQLAEGRTSATLVQAQALVSLIRDLQAKCNISGSKVYTHSQLSSKACSNVLHQYNWRDALLK